MPNHGEPAGRPAAAALPVLPLYLAASLAAAAAGGVAAQPVLSLASAALVAAALASSPVRGSWLFPVSAAAAASLLPQLGLLLLFGAAANPLAPGLAAALLNAALLLPVRAAPAAAAALAPRGAWAIASVAATAPQLLLRGMDWGFAPWAAALLAFALASGLAASRWGAASGLLYATASWGMQLFSPVAPAAPPLLAGLVAASSQLLTAAWLSSPRGRAAGPVPGLAVAAAASLAAVWLAMSKGYYLVVVATGSMEPSYSPGDIVLVAPGDPSPGDVAAYVQPGSRRIVLHRVVAETGDGRFIFKGDVNEAPDPPVPSAAVLGVAAAKLPLLGKPHIVLGERLGTPLALPGILAAAALLLAVAQRRSR